MMFGSVSLLGELADGNEWLQFFGGLMLLVAAVVVCVITVGAPR